jgi:NADH-quinone oxidoreductase subunit I
MASILGEVGGTITALAKGFGVTFRNLWRKTTTENYPDEPVHFQPRYRGIHVLQRDEDGLEKCVACFLCAAACPARCIYIEAAENTEANRISAAERYASVYNIDYSRCIFCGYCVEACPPRIRARYLRHQFHDLSQRAAPRVRISEACFTLGLIFRARSRLRRPHVSRPSPR